MIPRPTPGRVCVALYLTVIAIVVGSSLLRQRQEAAHARTAAALNAIWAAQNRFAEDDLDRDGARDYAESLDELIASGALSREAVSVPGYRFRVERGSWTWVVYGEPVELGLEHVGLGPQRQIDRSSQPLEYSLHRK